METEHYSNPRFGERSIVIRRLLSNLSSKAKYNFHKHYSGNEYLYENCLHDARSMSTTPVEDEDAEVVVRELIQSLSVERKGIGIVLTTDNGSDTYNGCVHLHVVLMAGNKADIHNAQHQQDRNVFLIDQLTNTDFTTCLVNNWETQFANMKSITAVSMKFDISSTASFQSEFLALIYRLLGKFIIHLRKNEWAEELMYKDINCIIKNLERKQLGAMFCCSDAVLSSSITRVGNVISLLHFWKQAPSIETKYTRKLMNHLACCSIEKSDITLRLVTNLETNLVRLNESFTNYLEMDRNIIASGINSVVLIGNLNITALKSEFMDVNNNVFDENSHLILPNVVKPYLVLSGMVACTCIYFALSQKRSISASKNSGSISVDLLVISCIILSMENVILLRDSTFQKKKQLYNYLLSKLQKYCEQNNDDMVYKKESVETLKTIIKQDDYTRNHTYKVCPVHNFYFDNLSNELNRVGTLRQYPAGDNCPSLIRLAAAGFYYTGKGSEVRCFSCDVSYSDWSYHSIPSEVHRRISPDCEYLNERFPIDKTHILPNSTDDSQRSVEHCHTSHEIGYQSS